MSLANVTGVFPGASVSGGDLTIPSGTVVSWTPTSTTVPGGYELVYGLLETLNQKVGTEYNNMSSSVATTVIGTPGSANSKIRRKYSFTIDLDASSPILTALNVVAATGTNA